MPGAGEMPPPAREENCIEPFHSPEPCEVVIIGCGGVLRGDDGVGPMLVSRLQALGVPPGLRLVDGGTAGLDVAFQMLGAREAVIVDACVSGAEAGAVFELAGEDLEALLPAGLNLHSLRWDHALALGRRLLGERFPPRVTVFLIEAQNSEPGYGLSLPVQNAMERLADELLHRYAKQR